MPAHSRQLLSTGRRLAQSQPRVRLRFADKGFKPHSDFAPAWVTSAGGLEPLKPTVRSRMGSVQA